ncbi:TadE/TadG family type IV pilus assembly protein [Edaphobacter aggregans]|uniref:TadE/TadG family type IV pilus assembly protein n=1 Tax=Edaphobacter aggregans TaxID=570835 RepID=UPI00068E0C98|nr:TadE/TadG family type IV pilus assembly protein [Edaphobacter aggregans]
MRLRDIQRCRSDRGSTLIEFGLIALMFMIMLVSVVELSRMMLVFNTVANSARAGARYAIVHGADRTGAGVNGPSGPGNTTQVETVVQNFAKAGLLTTGNLTITVAYPNGNNNAGSPVTVTVSYPYDPLIPYFSMLSRTVASTTEGVITF